MSVLGENAYGLFASALALALISASMVDLGAARYTTRALSQRVADPQQLVSSLATSRFVLSGLSAAICILIGLRLGFTGERIWTLLAASIYVLLGNIVLYLRSVFQAFEDLRAEGVSVVIEKFLVVGLGLAALLYWRRPDITLFAMSAGMLLSLAQTAWVVTKRFVKLSYSAFNLGLIRTTYQDMFALGIAGLIAAIYPRIDLLMIQSMLGDAAAGNYSAAYRLIEASYFVTAIVSMSALFPRFSRQNAEADKVNRDEVRKATILMAGVGAAIGGVLFLLSNPVMQLLSPEGTFVQSPELLRWLSWTLPLTFASSVLFTAMLALNDEKVLALFLVGLTICNVGLNAVLIPRAGMVGAASATIATEVLMICLYSVRYARLIRISD